MLEMPELDQSVLARRAEIVAALRAIVPGEGVISEAAELRPYESDGLTAYRQPPMVVVLPRCGAGQQGVPLAAPLRRAWPYAYPSRQGAVP
jgi:hypothetical protein